MAVRPTGIVVAPVVAALALMATVVLGPVSPVAAAGSAQPVLTAAPYEYLGWGDPPSPTAVMAATGVPDLTLAFILSKGTCSPAWDGT
ncbi:MAG: chitinase, partial [Acidimicrobiales bacterium]